MILKPSNCEKFDRVQQVPILHWTTMAEEKGEDQLFYR